jgi:hypothetical protein
MNRTADVNVQEKPDCAVVPVNKPNKEGQPSAEAGEGRAQTEENIVQSHMHPTQSGKCMSQGLHDYLGRRDRANADRRPHCLGVYDSCTWHRPTVPCDEGKSSFLRLEMSPAAWKNVAPHLNGAMPHHHRESVFVQHLQIRVHDRPEYLHSYSRS